MQSKGIHIVYPIAILIMILAGSVFIFRSLAGRKKKASVINASPSEQDSPGAGLRKMALTTPASKLGFAPDDEFPRIYGVLTDWDLDGVKVTVMSMRDGTASLYTTSQFGIIGGSGHENVRQAAKRYIKLAEKHLDSSEAVSEYAYPQSGEVYYYLLTYDGVRRCAGDETAINRGGDPTLPLFAAAQDVLTNLRMTVEKR